MKKTINTYKGVMIEKILNCKTHFEVLGIIDKKISLLSKANSSKAITNEFLNGSLHNLKQLNEKDIEPGQWSKIRAAISHLENLKMH